MQITPITIPAASSIDQLRDSVMLALNRVVSQINRAESIEDNGANALDIAGIMRSARNELYNAPVHGSKLKGGTLDIAPFASSIRPVILRATNPTLPDATYPAGTVMYNTTDFTLYKVNTAGTAWVKMINGGTDIQAGTITANEILANTITAGQIAAGAVNASELYAGEIKIGGVGGKAGTFGIYNSSNELVGFIGDSGTGFYGGYFTNLRVGPNLATPIVTASVTGVDIDGAKLVVTSTSLGVTATIDPAASGASIKIRSTTTPYPFINLGGVASGCPYIWLVANESTSYPQNQITKSDITITDSTTTSQASMIAASNQATVSVLWPTNSPTKSVVVLADNTEAYVKVTGGSYKIGTTTVINSSAQFVGAGVVCTAYGIAASGFNPYSGSTQYYGASTISQMFLTGVSSYLLRTNAGDLEYSPNLGVNWYSVGAGGIGLVYGASAATITGYGGVITGIA